MKNIDQKRVSELVIDEWIWQVFIILSILNISGDEYEKNYCYNNSIQEKAKAKKIFTLTVFASFLIYLYLACKNNYKYQNAKINNKGTTLLSIRCLASILVVIASTLFLIAQLNDKVPTNPSIQ